MGVDTHIFIKATHTEIYEFIKSAIDSEARLDHMAYISEEYYQIHFNFGDERRMMNIHLNKFGGVFVKKDEDWYYGKYQTYGESDSYTMNKQGIPDKTKGTYMSMGLWGASVEIGMLLCLEFGGWIDENDCDSEYYYEVPKGENKKPIFDYIFKKGRWK